MKRVRSTGEESVTSVFQRLLFSGPIQPVNWMRNGRRACRKKYDGNAAWMGALMTDCTGIWPPFAEAVSRSGCPCERTEENLLELCDCVGQDFAGRDQDDFAVVGQDDQRLPGLLMTEHDFAGHPPPRIACSMAVFSASRRAAITSGTISSGDSVIGMAHRWQGQTPLAQCEKKTQYGDLVSGDLKYGQVAMSAGPTPDKG